MKLKRIYILLMAVFFGIIVLSQAQSLFANYNIVEDMSLATSITSLKKGETVAITVSDTNVEDTKVVIPINENIKYIESDHQDASVVIDDINQQLVIDWLDNSKSQKVVTIILKIDQEGLYPLKALTVRENQEVSTQEVNVEVIALEEPPVESVNTEANSNSEQVATSESSVDNSASPNTIITGKWGTAPYEFNQETGELKIGSGELNKPTPWAYGGEIDGNLIKKLVFTEIVKAPTKSSGLFEGSRNNIDEIVGLSYLDTSNVTDMHGMFENASVTKLDLSNFNTSNVTDMGSMFSQSNLVELDVSNFDTSQVTDMSSLFRSTKSNVINVSGFDTSNVTDMSQMFSVSSVSEIDLSNFDTSKVTNMKLMFAYSNSKVINVSKFDTSNVTDMSEMFSSTSVSEIDLSNFNTSKVTNMFQMFVASSLKVINVSKFDTSNVTDMSQMFYNTKAEKLDLSNFDTSNVTDMSSMFVRSVVSELDLSNFDTSKVLKMDRMLSDISLSKLKLGEKFGFISDSNVGLGSPAALNSNDELTGNWIRENGSSKSYSPEEFMRNYGKDDLTPGIYVAETVLSGEITAEVNIFNQTHSDGLFYAKDELKIENTIHHTGDVYNFLYKTTIPEELTIGDEPFKGYIITDEGIKIDFPVEAFKFDESRRTLEVNLKSIVKPDNKGNYYTAVDADFYYEIIGKVNKEAFGKNLKINTTINYFNNVLNPKPDVNISIVSKEIYGLEPQWDLLKKIKNVSRSDDFIAVGDELEFTINATNSEELGAMSSFDLAENSFPNELDFISGSAELTLPDGTTKKMPDSIYQPDKQMVSTNVFSGDDYVGVKPYQIRFKAKVKDTAYGKILETKANLKGTTHAGKEITIEDDSVKINVAYSGKLGFKETPKILSFKDSFISAFTSTIERKEADWGVSIEDTRAQKQPWNLSVKQVSPFESTEGDKLTQVMIFRKNGIEDKGIDVDNEVDVYSENNPNPNDYFISWQKNEGFFLKVPPGTAKAKQYQTELQWNLKDTPI